MLYDNWKDELAMILGASFHQDIESIDDEIDSIINYNKKERAEIVYCIDELLNSSMSEKEKTKFIEDNTDIYFPAIEIEPLVWIKQLKSDIEKSLES